ncbi:MAG: hypothetical protein Q9170_002921 [Blastenia crenularia]
MDLRFSDLVVWTTCLLDGAQIIGKEHLGFGKCRSPCKKVYLWLHTRQEYWAVVHSRDERINSLNRRALKFFLTTERLYYSLTSLGKEDYPIHAYCCWNPRMIGAEILREVNVALVLSQNLYETLESKKRDETFETEQGLGPVVIYIWILLAEFLLHTIKLSREDQTRRPNSDVTELRKRFSKKAECLSYCLKTSLLPFKDANVATIVELNPIPPDYPFYEWYNRLDLKGPNRLKDGKLKFGDED